ncbi:MAG TPA: GNAT family N-acetyltransferase [Bryobacteraceae bacterium]|jgi:predicted GNAT family acetyltransferase
MRVSTFETPQEFENAAAAWLAQKPRRNNLILSILHRTLKSAEHARGWLVLSDDGPELALLKTPLHPPTMSDGSIEAAQCAAQFLPPDLPGIVGPSAVADAFSAEWCLQTSQSAHLHWEMTFYMLDRVEPFVAPAGELRRATLADLDELRPLAVAAAKAMNLPAAEQNPEEIEKRLQRSLAGNRQFMWTEGASIRAIAGYGESLPDAGARIGLVYTPLELRGRGYGSAITGSLAQLLLNQGQAWVSLFADDANPVSNRIYRRLGFRPELKYRTWLFG